MEPIFGPVSEAPSSVVNAIPLARFAGVTRPVTMWYLRILASSAWLSTMFISVCDSLLKALLAGTNAVKECIELRSLARPAALTSAANEVSSGLCAAAGSRQRHDRGAHARREDAFPG